MSIDLKKEAAREALKLIKDQSVVGLGAGITIAHIVDLLKEEVRKGFTVTAMTSSPETHLLLVQNKFIIPEITSGIRPDLYLDGCDQLDEDLNALKSGAGIHTHEKLMASMSASFVIIGDDSKYCTHFDGRYPLVIEVIPEAKRYVPGEVQKLFPGVRIVLRTRDQRDELNKTVKTGEAILTRNGNYLFDCWFPEWPELSTLNPMLKQLTGLLETSLFYGMADKAILAGKDGIHLLEKNRG